MTELHPLVFASIVAIANLCDDPCSAVAGVRIVIACGTRILNAKVNRLSIVILPLGFYYLVPMAGLDFFGGLQNESDRYQILLRDYLFLVHQKSPFESKECRFYPHHSSAGLIQRHKVHSRRLLHSLVSPFHHSLRSHPPNLC